MVSGGAWTALGGLQPSRGLLGGRSRSCLTDGGLGQYSALLQVSGTSWVLHIMRDWQVLESECRSVFSFGACQPVVVVLQYSSVCGR